MQTKYKKVQRIRRKQVENTSGGMHIAAAGLLEYLHIVWPCEYCLQSTKHACYQLICKEASSLAGKHK